MCRHTGENFLCLLHRQTRQTNSELRQRRSRPQKHTKSSCEARASWSCLQRPPLAQLVWAAAEAAATSTWVLRPLGGSRREKRTYQACAPAPHVQSNNKGPFEAQLTWWPLALRARRSDEMHKQATAPSPCTGGRVTRRRRCPQPTLDDPVVMLLKINSSLTRSLAMAPEQAQPPAERHIAK